MSDTDFYPCNDGVKVKQSTLIQWRTCSISRLKGPPITGSTPLSVNLLVQTWLASSSTLSLIEDGIRFNRADLSCALCQYLSQFSNADRWVVDQKHLYVFLVSSSLAPANTYKSWRNSLWLSAISTNFTSNWADDFIASTISLCTFQGLKK